MNRITTVRALACAFMREIEVDLTAGQLREVRRRNARRPPGAGWCATHDFIDSNESMGRAWAQVIGGAEDPASAAHMDLWNAAWAYADRRWLGGSTPCVEG